MYVDWYQDQLLLILNYAEIIFVWFRPMAQDIGRASLLICDGREVVFSIRGCPKREYG